MVCNRELTRAKQIRRALSGARRSQEQVFQVFHQVVIVVGINFKLDGHRALEAAYAEDGFRVDQEAALPQQDGIGIAICDVYEGIDLFGVAQGDVHCFHPITS